MRGWGWSIEQRRLLVWFDHEEGLSELDGVSIVDEALGDRSGLLGFDLVEDLHCFEEANDGVWSDLVTDIGEGWGVWVWFGVVGADHWGFDGDESRVGCVCGGFCWCGSGCGGGCCWSGCGLCWCLVDDGFLVAATLDGDGFGLVSEVEFGEFIFDHEFDEFFKLADVDHVHWS